MKKSFLIIVFSVLFSGAISAQSSWILQPSPLGNQVLGKIQFVSASEGWISVGNGKLLHTVNSGNNWTVVSPEPIDSLFSWSDPAQSMSFINPSTGWIVRTKGNFNQWNGAVAYKTTNGGNSWTYITNTGLTSGHNCKAVFFINANTGWIGTKADGTQTSYILYTNNGGADWTWQTHSSLDYSIFSIHFFDANNGGLVEDYGGIYHTTNGGVHVNNISTEIPTFYSLSQNYPNPFNPSTSIEFDVVQSADVKISVFDIYGKEINVLVNERLQAGRYKTEWNGTGHSSGVYFYRMQSGNFLQTKQMILLK